MSLVSWYYWRKFQKLKDELINQHNFNEAYSRYRLGYLESLQEQPKIQNISSFKFFRG